MLSDSNFRKTSKCSYYKNFLSKKQIPAFPIQRVSPEFLNTTELIHSTGFNKPFVIKASDNITTVAENNLSVDNKLGIVLPSRDKDLTYVSEIVGPSHPVKIIEVGQQAEISDWTLGEYAQYLKSYRAEDHKVLNMITLEFSATPFNAKVQAPTFVRDLDWIDTIWPIERRARGDHPKVQKYCLAGMAGSYTDFHIDFGGTSVWYHVLTGQKRFYLVPPTTSNLRAFEKWTCSSAQSDVFFGDLLDAPDQCFQFDLNPGETFMIPSGWIHAVFTPVDSLVFGGNFVHSYAILRQLQIYSIEHRTRVQKAYRFPFFRQINWYFLVNLLPLARVKYCNKDDKKQESTTEKASSWVDDMMSDDDEPEIDDLQATCDGLKDPIVLYQLPYLVKTCALWHAEGGGQERGVFEVSLADTGCSNVEEVLAQWWEVLLAIAATLSSSQDATAKENASDDSAHSRDAALAHIRSIQSLQKLDLLDDAVVRPVFGAFEQDLQKILPGSAKPVSKSEENAEPLKLKFSFKRPAPTASASVTSHEELAKKDQNVSELAEAKFKFAEEPHTTPAATASQPKFTLTHTASSAPVLTNVVDSAVPKKPIALKLTLKSQPVEPPKASNKATDAPAVKSTNTVSSRSTRPTSSTSQSTSSSDNIEAMTERAGGSQGARRYGTRGLKLSKDFLNRAMDVDIGDYEPGDGSGDEALRDDAEEEEFAHESRDRFGRVIGTANDEHDGHSHAATRNLTKKSDFSFRERDDDGAANVPGSAPTGTFLDSENEDSDHMMGSDAEEDFSDEDGFIVNDSASKKGGSKRKQSSARGIEPAPKRLPKAEPVVKQYFVDRLSETAERNARANAGVVLHHQQQSTTSVPQIQGVRINTGSKKPAAPLNNRMKIMKKLGLK